MNSENNKPLVNKLSKTTKFICAQSVILSLSILLGACAANGSKEAETVSPSATSKTIVSESSKNKAAPVKTETAEKQTPKVKEAPQPTAAELMKTLKAPLVEPPTVKSVPAPVAEKQIAAKTEAAVVAAEAKVKAVAAPVKEEPVKQVVETKAAVAVLAPEPVAPVVASPEPVVASASSSAKAFAVSAKKLPFNYDIWTIRQGNTPLTKGLVITTPTWEMGKEGYMSQIWLTLMEDKIHVNSSSDIETASKGLGIRIDGGDLIPFTTIAETNIGVIDGKWLDKLAAAKKVQMYLGFFPGKVPTSDTFSSELSMENLDRMVATYRLLNK